MTVPVAFPPSLLSVDPVFHFPCSSPAAFACLSSFCFSSCDFFPPASCILHHPFCIFIRRFRFPVWFCTLERIQNEGKNEGKIHDKQELAHRLPHPATTAITTIATAGPSYAFAASICLTSTSKAPTAPPSRDCCCCCHCYCSCFRCHCCFFQYLCWSTSHSTNPGTHWLLPLARNDDCAMPHIYL